MQSRLPIEDLAGEAQVVGKCYGSVLTCFTQRSPKNPRPAARTLIRAIETPRQSSRTPETQLAIIPRLAPTNLRRLRLTFDISIENSRPIKPPQTAPIKAIRGSAWPACSDVRYAPIAPPTVSAIAHSAGLVPEGRLEDFFAYARGYLIDED
jgi:hypothetical protein